MVTSFLPSNGQHPWLPTLQARVWFQSNCFFYNHFKLELKIVSPGTRNCDKKRNAKWERQHWSTCQIYCLTSVTQLTSVFSHITAPIDKLGEGDSGGRDGGIFFFHLQRFRSIIPSVPSSFFCVPYSFLHFFPCYFFLSLVFSILSSYINPFSSILLLISFSPFLLLCMLVSLAFFVSSFLPFFCFFCVGKSCLLHFILSSLLLFYSLVFVGKSCYHPIILYSFLVSVFLSFLLPVSLFSLSLNLSIFLSTLFHFLPSLFLSI